MLAGTRRSRGSRAPTSPVGSSRARASDACPRPVLAAEAHRERGPAEPALRRRACGGSRPDARPVRGRRRGAWRGLPAPRARDSRTSPGPVRAVPGLVRAVRPGSRTPRRPGQVPRTGPGCWRAPRSWSRCQDASGSKPTAVSITGQGGAPVAERDRELRPGDRRAQPYRSRRGGDADRGTPQVDGLGGRRRHRVPGVAVTEQVGQAGCHAGPDRCLGGGRVQGGPGHADSLVQAVRQPFTPELGAQHLGEAEQDGRAVRAPARDHVDGLPGGRYRTGDVVTVVPQQVAAEERVGERD